MIFNSKVQGTRTVSIMLGCPPNSGRYPVTRCRICNVPVEYAPRKAPFCKQHMCMRGKV